MRLPRCLVVSLLTVSILAVLGAGAWWWDTWPERTAKQFVELIATNRGWDASKMMTDPNPPLDKDFIVVDAPQGWQQIEPQPRSLMDMMSGTAQYRIPTSSYWTDDWTFTVSRGQIVEHRWIGIALVKGARGFRSLNGFH